MNRNTTSENPDQTPEEPPADLRTRAFGALGSTSVVVVIDRILQIGLMIVVARLVGPSETAVAAAVNLVVSMAALISSWGMTSALIQMPGVTGNTRAVARTMLALSGALALLVVEVGAPLAQSWFSIPQVVSALRLGALVLLTQCFSLVALAHILRRLGARDAALADLISSFVGTGLITIPMALAGFGYWSLVVGMMVQTAVRTVILCVFDKGELRFGRDTGQARLLSRKGFGFLLTGFLNRCGLDAPKWLVGRYLPAADLGVYSKANALMTYPSSLFASVVERVVFPAVGLAQSDPARVQRGVIEAVQLTALIGGPMTAALFLLGPDVIRLLLGPAWEGAVLPFTILSLAIYFRIADRLNWVVLRGLGRPYLLSVLQIMDLVLLVSGCAFGARYGLAGISAVVVAVMTVSYFATSAAAMAVTRIRLRDWLIAHAPAAMTTLLAAGCLWPIVGVLHEWGVGPFGVIGLAGAAAGLVIAAATTLAPKIFLGPAGGRLLTLVRGLIFRRAL